MQNLNSDYNEAFCIFYSTNQYHVSFNYEPQNRSLTSDIMDKSDADWVVVSSLTQEWNSDKFKTPFSQFRNMLKTQREKFSLKT